MIKFFNANDRDFKTNGLFSVKPLKAIETKKKSLNGWELEVELPISYKDDIEQDMIALASVKSKQNSQAFRIKNIKKTSRKLSFTAEHVMFDARDYFLLDVRPTNMGAPATLKYLNERTDTPSPFFVSSNVSNSATAYFIRKSLLEAWEVVEERWGGSFDADNWNISLQTRVGNDNGEIISYGKNLEDIKVFEDWSDVVTRLYPVGNDGLMLPEKFIEADLFYPTPYTKTVTMHSDEEETEDMPEEVLIEELREKAKEYLKVNKYPKVSYEVKSDVNQDLEIGDTITVNHPIVTLETEVLEYTYNLNTKRTESLVFGNYSRDVKKVFDSYKKDINDTKNQLTNVEQIIGHQTDLINSLNKEGYVVRNENETLILDKKPKEAAKYVWRFGMGGIGFSTNGYEGPFTMAWTQDGMLNTDFISAGTIMTNHLHSDVGSSLDLTSNESINLIVNKLKLPNLWVNSTGVMGTDGYTFDVEPIKINDPDYPMVLIVQNYTMGRQDPLFTVVPYKSLSGYALNIDREGVALSDPRLLLFNEKVYFHTYINGEAYKDNKLSISVLELDKDKKLIEEVPMAERIPNGSLYHLKHEFMPSTDTMYVQVKLTAKGTPTHPITVYDGVLSYKDYLDYTLTSQDVLEYSKSQINMLDSEIELSAKKIDALNGDIHNAGVEINAKDGVTTYGKKFSVMNSERTKELLGVTTIDGEETIKIDISGGSLGNMELDNGKMVITSPEYERQYKQSDLSAIKTIIESGQSANGYEIYVYDVNNDGKVNHMDYIALRNYMAGNRELDLPIIQSQVEIGNQQGQVISRVLYDGGKAGNETLIQADNIQTGTIEAKGISIGGKSVEADDNGFLKLV